MDYKEESEKLTKSLWNIFNYLNFVVVLLDPNMNILLGNFYLAQLVGLDSEALLTGRNWLEFIDKSEEKIIRFVHANVLEDVGDCNEHINDIKTLTGTKIPIRWFNSKINQGFEGTFSIGIPITQTITQEDTIDSMRAYWSDIIKQDKTTIQAMKKFFDEQIKSGLQDASCNLIVEGIPQRRKSDPGYA
jgi:PAS domain S-box-containing protein